MDTDTIAVIICLAGMLSCAGALAFMVRNFIRYHEQRGTAPEHIWEIAWRGKSAGDSP